jgi:hypothetical protein
VYSHLLSLCACSSMASRRPASTRPSASWPALLQGREHVPSHHLVDSTHMMQIQSELTQRCLELLALPEDQPCLLLDIGSAACLSLLSVFPPRSLTGHWVAGAALG